MISSIAMDANNSFYVKFISTDVPTFFGYIFSVLGGKNGYLELLVLKALGGIAATNFENEVQIEAFP